MGRMFSSKMALKVILYIIFIPLVSGRPHLPQRPLPRAGSHQQGVKIPPYMMNLYHMLTGTTKDLRRPEIHILNESDTIQSLTAKDFIVEDNQCSLTFDLSPISRTDELRMVQLQVHLPSFAKSSNLTVNIYHSNDGQNKLYLGSVVTYVPDIGNTSWATFNVTKIMENSLPWGRRPTNNRDGEKKSVSMPESLRKIKKRDVSPPETTTDQAIIVFFTKHTSYSEADSPNLLKKMLINTLKRATFHKHKKTKSEIQPVHPSSDHPIVVELHNPSCRKVDMVVDFKELGWDNWVVYPKKYNAYRCEGTCHSPRKETSKTTNHDYIKSFIKLKDSERIECPSCVPLKMQPLSMIFHENRHLVVKHQNDMIIEECGFQ